jgi:hypothetical protein
LVLSDQFKGFALHFLFILGLISAGLGAAEGEAPS